MREFETEELENMEFNDEFEKTYSEIREEEYDDEGNFCSLCGSLDIKIGYNKKEDIFKIECSKCGGIIIEDENTTMRFKGEERDWPEYLSETLKFPFIGQITEMTDREFFNPDDPGPILYLDEVHVVAIDYSFKYGIVAILRISRRHYEHPLCFVDPVDDESKNYDEVKDYQRWRERHWLSDYIAALSQAFGKNKDDEDDEDDDE